MLLTAYNALRYKRPNLNLDLAFTGAPSAEEAKLKSAVAQMNLSDHVHFLGFLSDKSLVAIYGRCLGVIYPSLYEGFGIPLVEAFMFNKPVLCSDTTSLPEVAKDAARYFNPRKPDEIMKAIEIFLDEPDKTTHLVHAGQERLDQFHPSSMIANYKDCFDQAILNNSTDGRYFSRPL